MAAGCSTKPSPPATSGSGARPVPTSCSDPASCSTPSEEHCGSSPTRTSWWTRRAPRRCSASPRPAIMGAVTTSPDDGRILGGGIFDADALAALSQFGTEREVAVGDVLFRAGDASYDLF